MFEVEGEITIRFLSLVNQSSTTRELMKNAIEYFQQVSGCEAVGIRVREGDDYPYYEARGFPVEFIRHENSLCTFLSDGEPLRDHLGNPVLECMCGNIISGRFDPSLPFFTPQGSFWTNSTTQLLASTTAADRQASTRNRCLGEGYESMALIPLSLGAERLGLLQLNDRRKGVFSPALVALWERLVGYIAIALGKSRAEEALRESEERYRRLFEGNHAVMLLIDPEGGAIVDANPAATAYYGWSRDELRRKKIGEINILPPAEVQAQIDLVRLGMRGSFLFRHRLADGRIRDVEVFSGPISLKNRSLLFSIVHDISARRRREAILEARLTLSEFALSHSLEELLQKTLDEAERLTGSRIGFFHFVAADERMVQRQMWSTNTLKGMCTADRSTLHSDIEEAGVWVDCVRHRRAVIHNDYMTLPHRKGLPRGHAPVARELVVPVTRGNQIVAILGVGNKPEDYSSDDVEAVSLLADLAWDITERKRSEKALQDLLRGTRASEERLSVILSSVTDGLLALDGDGRVTLMNPAAEHLLNTCAEKGVGQSAREIIHNSELLSCCLNLLAGVAATGTVEIAMYDAHRRETRAIQARLAVLPESEGKRQGIIVTLFDVTRDREIERLKSEFVMTAAHELRTPLTAVLGYAELLELAEKTGQFTSAQRREFIGYIIEKGETLAHIISDLLDLGRIEGSRPLLLEKAPWELSQIIEGAVDHYRRETKCHHFEIKASPPDVRILVDKARISQVLDNLLTNAVKYSPAGGIILVEGEMVGGEIHISVTDQGIGMTSEQAERIFEKFYRADSSMTAVGGLGLGMCVAKGIVEAHDGRIWVESAPHQGTRVIFTLPLGSPSAGVPGQTPLLPA